VEGVDAEGQCERAEMELEGERDGLDGGEGVNTVRGGRGAS